MRRNDRLWLRSGEPFKRTPKAIKRKGLSMKKACLLMALAGAVLVGCKTESRYEGATGTDTTSGSGAVTGSGSVQTSPSGSVTGSGAIQTTPSISTNGSGTNTFRSGAGSGFGSLTNQTNSAVGGTGTGSSSTSGSSQSTPSQSNQNQNQGNDTQSNPTKDSQSNPSGTGSNN